MEEDTSSVPGKLEGKKPHKQCALWNGSSSKAYQHTLSIKTRRVRHPHSAGHATPRVINQVPVSIAVELLQENTASKTLTSWLQPLCFYSRNNTTTYLLLLQQRSTSQSLVCLFSIHKQRTDPRSQSKSAVN